MCDKNALFDDFYIEYSDENDLIENVINSANYLKDNDNNCENNSRNEADTTCVNIDNWFDQLIKDQIKRNTEHDATCSKANSDMLMLKEELKLGNEKTSQQNVNELANQRLFLMV